MIPICLLFAAAVSVEAECQLPQPYATLLELAEPQPEPRSGEWRWYHREPHQAYGDYVQKHRQGAAGRRQTILVQPIGEFGAGQQAILGTAAEYLGPYFGAEIRLLATVPLRALPPTARRMHPELGIEQLHSGYLIEKYVAPRRRGAALITGVTAYDLWPGGAVDFVFGEAMVGRRAGVWSLARNGDPDASDEAYRRCLRRTLNTASHETGHLLGLAHCTRYVCNMAGSNHVDERDRRPLWLCGECLAKVAWSTGLDAAARSQWLARFYIRQGMKTEAAHEERVLEILGR